MTSRPIGKGPVYLINILSVSNIAITILKLLKAELYLPVSKYGFFQLHAILVQV